MSECFQYVDILIIWIKHALAGGSMVLQNIGSSFYVFGF